MEIPQKANLKLYQVPLLVLTGLRQRSFSGVPLCNTYEHETTIAEHLMGAMIEWQPD